MAEEIVQINREKDQEKKEFDKTWAKLPLELLQLVSAHDLFVTDHSTFRAICKSWRLSTPISRPLLSILDFPHSQSPCLLSVDNYKCSFFNPICNSTYRMEIPELLGAMIRYSKYGWLLLSQADFSVFFFHPFSKIKIKLPSYRDEYAFETMCFSSPPTSGDCVVIGVTFAGMQVGFIRRGELDWTICQFKRDSCSELSGCTPVLYKGKFYCLYKLGRLAVFDLNEYFGAPNQHSCSWTVFSTGLPEHICDSYELSYLVEDNGKLFAVFEMHDCEPSVYIFSLNLSPSGSRSRMNWSHMKWHEVRNLRNKMLYVSPGSLFSELAAVEGMSNTIYLPKVQDNSNVFYSLKTKNYHSFFSDYSTRISSYGRELNNSSWIIPMLTTAEEEFSW